MAQRIMTAIIGIPIFLGGLYFGGTFWKVTVLFLIFVGLLEFARMAGPGVYLDYLLASGLSFLLITYSGITDTKLLIWLASQTIYYLLRASFGGMHNFSSAFNLLGVLYVAIPLSFLWIVRDQFGVLWAIFGIGITWLTDSGAYFGGSRYGKHKLIPKISPNKTVEGSLCGIASAVVGAIVFAVVTQKPVGLVGLFALLLSVFAQLGDLVESAFKRECAVKDSGSLLPGHGGVLDRFDSIGFVFPVLFICLTLLF